MAESIQKAVPVRSRVAVHTLFAAFGMIVTTWAVHLPSLKEAVGMSTAMVGVVLLALGAGSLAGMQLSGVLIDRYGAAVVAVAGAAAMAVLLPVPLVATSVGHAMAGAFVFGVAAGNADVGMNAAAVHVERDYGRPIMSAFHAVFSIGTVVGSLLGAVGFALGVGVSTTAVTASAICLVIDGLAALGFRGRFSRPEHSPQRAEERAATVPATPVRGRSRRVLLLGALAFLLLLAEGSAMDWASLHAQQHLGASPSLGALAVGAFLVAMTVCRFVSDRIAHAAGPMRVLRFGSMLAAVGILTVNLAPSLPVVAVGWVLFGLGLAGGIPQVFTAAGNVDGDTAGRGLSRVVGLGYVAILAGPAVIGWLVQWAGWHGAWLLPLVAVMFCAAAAPVVSPGRAPVGTDR